MAESALPAQPMESPAAQDQTGPEKGAGCTLYNSTKTDTGCTTISGTKGCFLVTLFLYWICSTIIKVLAVKHNSP